MERNFKILVLSSLIALNFSCKKNSPVEPPLIQPPKLATGVYAVGTHITVTNGSKGQAAIWTNGVMSLLSTNISGAGDIAIQDTNIYVSGYVNEGGTDVACYWKNGVITKLQGGGTSGAQATDIIVKANDVYVIGTLMNGFYSGYEPAYWKNGVMTKLDAGGKQAGAAGLALIGSDVYVSGYCLASNNRFVACYWKNGVLNQLAANAFVAGATEITASGNDLYIIGYTSGASTDVSPPYAPEPVLWKNGTLTKLTTTKPNTNPTHVVVQGSDVYVSGAGGPDNAYTGMYWQNGVNTLIPNSLYASGIAVQGNDCYVGGYYKNASEPSTYYAGIWKNGSPIFTAKTASQIFDLVVVP